MEELCFHFNRERQGRPRIAGPPGAGEAEGGRREARLARAAPRWFRGLASPSAPSRFKMSPEVDGKHQAQNGKYFTFELVT